LQQNLSELKITPFKCPTKRKSIK